MAQNWTSIVESNIYRYIYIYVKLRENPIRFQIGIQLEFTFAPHVLSNLIFKIFVPS